MPGRVAPDPDALILAADVGTPNDDPRLRALVRLDRLGVSEQAQLALACADLLDLDRLRTMPDDDLLAVPGIGARRFAEIRAAVDTHPLPAAPRCAPTPRLLLPRTRRRGAGRPAARATRRGGDSGDSDPDEPEPHPLAARAAA